MTNHVVSFSGGRTSAYLVYLIESMRKKGEWTDPVEYIFMDTGAEHPKTYDFIRQVVSDTGINLTCLQGNFNQPVGEGHGYNVARLEDIKFDMVNGPFARMMVKYGTPTIMGAWCTSRMKEETHDKYCDDKYGKGNYVTWLGIRDDEPRRLKIGKTPRLRYMAEITDFDKQDVISWWSKMPFDLEIPEHLGNCVFCFKKSHAKVALAAIDEPSLLSEWKNAISNASDRLNASREKVFDDMVGGVVDNSFSKGVMYRNRKTIDDVIAVFPQDNADYVRQLVYRGSKDSGGCSESCEAFATQDELF